MADTKVNTGHVQMPLAQIVDLVVNSPEEGVVNFHLLQTVLRVIVNHINANQVSVELQGTGADKLQNMVSNPLATMSVINIAEQNIEGSPSVLVVEGPRGAVNTTNTITKVKLDRISNEVEGLKSQVKELTELPSSTGIVEALKSGGASTPILDMYQILALVKRVDAAEMGMKKMASMVEELLKRPTPQVGAPSKHNIKDAKKSIKPKEKTDAQKKEGEKGEQQETTVDESSDKPKQESQSSKETAKEGDRKKSLGEKGAEKKESSEGGSSPRTPRSPPRSPTSKQRSERSEENVEFLNETVDETRERLLAVEPELVIESLIEEIIDLRKYMITVPEEVILDMRAEIIELQAILSGKKKSRANAAEVGVDDDGCDLPTALQLQLLEERFRDYTDHLEQMDQMFNDEITKLQNQFTDIEKDFNEILLKIQGGLPSGDHDPDEPNQCCALVYQKLVKLEHDFNQLTDTSLTLLKDKDEKQLMMDQMLEQIDLLRSIKADREDIEEALADKADACTVHRKVSHDQFDNACDELSKGIEDALEKLTQQEVMWQQALESIQSEIGNKLDKMDLGPLREFINNKLKMLQDRMKSLAAMKKEQEAAGSKSKFLRNVNCISCDKDVVMRKEMDSTLRPQAMAVPPTRSMGPYLAYELDSLRKQRKSLPGSRNMNYLESALAGAKGGKKGDDHICNRYCGGSHTTTTPQQRVTRLGHFLAQWGNDAIQVESKVLETQKSFTASKLSVSAEAARGKSINAVDEAEVPTKDDSKGKLNKEASRHSKTGSLTGAGRRSSEGSAKRASIEGRASTGSVRSKNTVRSSASKQEKAISINSNIPEETASQVAVEEGELPMNLEDEGGELGEMGEGTVAVENKSKEALTETAEPKEVEAELVPEEEAAPAEAAPTE